MTKLARELTDLYLHTARTGRKIKSNVLLKKIIPSIVEDPSGQTNSFALDHESYCKKSTLENSRNQSKIRGITHNDRKIDAHFM